MWITATIEDTTIIQLFGNSKEFERRVIEYAERTAAKYILVIPLPGLKVLRE